MAFYSRGKHITFNTSAAGLGEAPYAPLLDIMNVALMRVAYVFNADTQEQFDDIVANELVATSYASRGNALAGKVFTRDDGNSRIEFDATDLVFTAIGNGTNDTFDEIVVNREQDAGATDANTELVASALVSATTTNGGNITLVFNVEGILQLA